MTLTHELDGEDLPRCDHCGHDWHGIHCQYGAAPWWRPTAWATFVAPLRCDCETTVTNP